MRTITLIKIGFFIVLFLMTNLSVTAQQVTWEEATKIALEVSGKIFGTDYSTDFPANTKIIKFDPIKYEEKIIGYIFYFEPKGYVIVPRCREMRPYFMASGNENYESAASIIETFLKPVFTKNYLAVINNSLPQNQITRNRDMWNQYLAEN